jgi:GH24 family phage-related lysozyme (muramidase)
MRINAAGLKIIKDAEGLRLNAYKCPAGVKDGGDLA